MRKFLISAALISATAISASPAAAQGWGYNNRGGQGIERRIDNIENRIHRAAQNRQISHREADRLLRQANQLDRLAYRYGRNGLTQREHRQLQQRVDHLQQQLRWERQEDRRRWR